MSERREFLKSLTGLTTGLFMMNNSFADPNTPTSDRLGEWLPARPLGRTGESVTMLGLGGRASDPDERSRRPANHRNCAGRRNPLFRYRRVLQQWRQRKTNRKNTDAGLSRRDFPYDQSGEGRRAVGPDTT